MTVTADVSDVGNVCFVFIASCSSIFVRTDQNSVLADAIILDIVTLILRLIPERIYFLSDFIFNDF
jgi:hypothetical protein